EHIRVHLDGTAGDKIFISQPIKGVISDQWTVQFTRAVRDSRGRLIGILVASYEFEDFINFYSQLRTGEDGIITVTGLNGVVWARSTPLKDATPAIGKQLGPEFMSRILREPEGRFRRESPIDGVDRVGYYVKSNRFPLIVTVATNIDYVIAK